MMCLGYREFGETIFKRLFFVRIPASKYPLSLGRRY